MGDVPLGRALLLALVFACQPVTGNELFDRLQGTWAGTGTVRGMASQATLVFSLPLNGRFLKLEFRNSMQLESGSSVSFEGDAYYAVSDGPGSAAMSGRWFDSRGYQMPVAATIDGSTMIADWGAPDIEQGRTRYALDGNRLIVTDLVLVDGEFREFGRVQYQQQ